MAHIRQIKSYNRGNSTEEAQTYTVVNSQGYEDDLTQHPSIVNKPERFEITEDAIPEDGVVIQYLNYISEDPGE